MASSTSIPQMMPLGRRSRTTAIVAPMIASERLLQRSPQSPRLMWNTVLHSELCPAGPRIQSSIFLHSYQASSGQERASPIFGGQATASTLWSDDARVWNLSQVFGSERTQKVHIDDARAAAALRTPAGEDQSGFRREADLGRR